MRAIDLFRAQERDSFCQTEAQVQERQEQAEKKTHLNTTQRQSGFTTHLDNTSHILMTASDLQELFLLTLVMSRVDE